MNELTLQYNDNNITFHLGDDDVMINATEMAKPFKKQAFEWLRLPSTRQFMTALEATGKSRRSDLVKTINGVGTWFHEDVALEFARWLSPAFAIWCNERIKELFRHGMTATEPTLEKIADNPELLIQLATNLKKEREEKEKLVQENKLKDEIIENNAPKVEYYDKALQSESVYNTTQIAKEFGWSAKMLNLKLQKLGIQFLCNGQWVLYSRYQNKGYTKTNAYPYGNHEDGTIRTRALTVWTEKGRKFLHDLFD